MPIAPHGRPWRLQAAAACASVAGGAWQPAGSGAAAMLRITPLQPPSLPSLLPPAASGCLH